MLFCISKEMNKTKKISPLIRILHLENYSKFLLVVHQFCDELLRVLNQLISSLPLNFLGRRLHVENHLTSASNFGCCS